MKKLRMNRVLSALLALVMCIGMAPATVTLASAAVTEVFKDDFSAYMMGPDSFWKNVNYTTFEGDYHGAVGGDSYATYGIVDDGTGNKVLELVPVYKTGNYFESREMITGERGFSVDIFLPEPTGSSLPGLVFNLLARQALPRGYAMLYVDAQGDVKIREELSGSLNQYKMDLRPEYNIWYTVKGWLSEGRMIMKMWPRDKAEPADTAGPEEGVVVFENPVLDSALLSGQSRLGIQSRNRNLPGEAYPVQLDNLKIFGTPVGSTPGVIPTKLSLPDVSVGKTGTQLVPELTGVELDNPLYTWVSSDPSVVSVENGKAVAVKNGTATVTANLMNVDGTVAISASCTVTANATGIDRTGIVDQHKAGDTVSLKLTSAGSTAKWTSSDHSVATVDANGTVSCMSRGSAVITAVWPDTDGTQLSDTITLQVGAPTMGMKILMIGDNYSIDTAFYFKKLDRLYPDVNFDLAVLHGGDISVQGHARNAIADAAAYALYAPDADGNLAKVRDNVRISELLADEEWDIVSVGNFSYTAGYEAAYRTDMKYMVDYLRDNEPGAKLWWPVAWSYADGYTPYPGEGVNKANGIATYLENSAWMYNAIIRCTNRYILGRSDWFDFAVPTGVAVQNLRAALGRDLTRDKDHLSNKTGRLTAGLTLFYGLCLNMGYAPDLSQLNENTVNFLVNDVAQYPDKDYKASDLSKIAEAVKAAYVDMSDKKLTELNVPGHPKNTAPGVITVDQVQAPTALRFPDIKKLPDGRLVAAYTDNPTHGVDKSNPIILGQDVHFAISEDNGETWSVHELFDLEKAAEMNAPGLAGAYDRYEMLQNNPGASYVVAGMGNDSDLLPVKMDLNNDGKVEDALLYTCAFYNVKSTGDHNRHVAMTWISVEDLDGWLAGKAGKGWSDFQLVVNDSKRGDAVQFNDGTMLFPIYGSNKVRVLDMTFNPKSQKWEWGAERNVPNLAPEGDWTSAGDAFNEFSLISPDGTDKVVYGMVRSSGVIYATYDRGRTWELVANEPGSAQQPQFAYIDTNRAFVTWSDESNVRNTLGKVFYFDAGWDETETRLIYKSSVQIGQDTADPSCVYTDEGTVMTIQYDTGYLSIVGVKDDPNSEEFLPNTLTAKELVAVSATDSVSGKWIADKKPAGSFIMEFDLTLSSESAAVEARMRSDVGVKFSTKGVACLEGTCVQNTVLTIGTKYRVKVAAIGKMLWGKIWADGSAEPAWAIWCTDHINKSLTTAATLTVTGSAAVENAAVKIPAMLDVEQSITANVADFPRAISYDRYNSDGTMVWTSSDPKVASVDQDGVLTFNAAGKTTVTVTLGEVKRTVQVTVLAAPAELTGEGEKKVFQTEDFSSYPVGDNAFYAYMGPDKAFDTAHNGSASTENYSIVEESGNKFLRLYDDTVTASPWIMSNTAVTGNYTVQLDYRLHGTNSLYLTLFQKDASPATHPNTAMVRLHGNIGLQIAGGEYHGSVPYQQWATVKVTCINGAVYCKLWLKGQPEPAEWPSVVQVPGLTTATANHLRMQFHSGDNGGTRNLLDIDNLVVTQQQVEGIGAMTDVVPGAWYYDAVDYVINNKIMSGYNATTFGPNDTLNRAMVVQVLYNKEGQPDLNGAKHSFSDVPASQWYNNAVTWGSNRGVVSGYGGGVFKPEDAVTIEQVAVILWNYSNTPIGSGDLSKVGNHSDWAANALKWAVDKGILNNVPFTNATEKATRAQTAQMLTNYLRAN